MQAEPERRRVLFATGAPHVEVSLLSCEVLYREFREAVEVSILREEDADSMLSAECDDLCIEREIADSIAFLYGL